MKKIGLLPLSIAIGAGVFVAIPAALADIALPDFGEPQVQEVEVSSIVDAVKNAALMQAGRLLSDLALQEIHQQLFTEKGLAILAKKHGDEIARILNDTVSPPDKKAFDIMKLLDSEIIPIKSPAVGDLNIGVMHSPEFGAAKLVWDSKVVVDKCYEWVVTVNCDVGYDGFEHCYYGGYYSDIYYQRVPDYTIYRIVDGQAELLLHISGKLSTKSNTFGVSTNNFWEVLARSAYEWSEFSLGFDSASQALAIDWLADYRNKGTTLAYKVIADNSGQESCKSNQRWESEVTVDANGDGLMDFIPSSEYNHYFSKYFGWMIPVITSL